MTKESRADVGNSTRGSLSLLVWHDPGGQKGE